jgi:hypothetical protein
LTVVGVATCAFSPSPCYVMQQFMLTFPTRMITTHNKVLNSTIHYTA